MTTPFALSVHHFISTVGADAGFAAIIGLAILVLLYFAQARETATLREQAAHAAEQIQQLEYRLAQLARGVAPAPAPSGPRAGIQPAQAAAAPPAARTVAPGRAPAPVAAAPAAPAGVGAPALASATRLIPGFDEGAISVRAKGANTAAAAAAGAAGAGYADVPGRGGGSAVMSPPGPPPATAAGGAANGGSTGRPSSPAPVAAPPPPRTGQAPPRQPVRNGANRPPAPASGRFSEPPRRSGARGLLLGLAGLAVVAVIVVGLLVLTSGGSASHSSTSAAATSTAVPAKSHRRGPRAALKPSAVTVAVLNGTSTPNLAHDISAKLGGAGYKPGAIKTATDQTQTATVVGYLPGQRAAALIVAKSLALGPASVQPVDSSNQAVACPQATACSAQVIVTVGSDLASAASTASTPAATGAPGQTTTAAATT